MRLLHFGAVSGPLFRCAACGHHFLGTTEEVHSLIEETYAHDYVGHRVDPVFAERAYQAWVKDVRPLASGKRLLDVGCGNGQFLQIVTEDGYDCEGIELSAEAVEHCRALGLHASTTNFLTGIFEHPFNIITMWDVVEHLHDPKRFIERSRELLSPGGLLVLKIPGFELGAMAAVRVVPRLAKSLLGAPDHVQYFNHRSLTTLLERTGFGDMTWFRSRDFRSKPDTTSMKRRASRAITKAVGVLGGARNLFLAAKVA